MCHFENIRLENCPTQFIPVVYRKYVDDAFLRFPSTEDAENFKKYLNNQHKHFSFTSAVEQNESLSFLDIKINGKNNKSFTSADRKPIFSGVSTNFESFISICYKLSLIDTLLYGGFSLCSNIKKFHQEISSPKTVLKRSD